MVYADATALIGLARIDRLDLLTVLDRPIYVTRTVWDEVTRDPSKPGTEALLRALVDGLLTVVDEGDGDAIPGLDAGESTLLTAAAAAGADVVLDERTARALLAGNELYRTAIPLATGVLGILLRAKQEGRIASVRDLMDDLLHEGFRISNRVYREVLEQAGET